MLKLLSTKILPISQQKLVLNAGIKLLQYDAIQIVPVNFEMAKKIENAIFTSQNAVKAIMNKESADQTGRFGTMNCFCVGKKTKNLLKKKGANLIAWTEYGKDLAELIVKNHRNENFVFFCGTRRREEIPSILKENKVDFEEIHLYQTNLVPRKFDQNIDGILFFSPSGVESFCLQNDLKNKVAFCIGTTTAAEAKKHTDKIVIADEPIVENVVELVINFQPTF